LTKSLKNISKIKQACTTKLGKSQKVFLIWFHPPQKVPNHCPSTFSFYVEKMRDSNLIGFFEDGAKLETLSEIIPLLTININEIKEE
jgi:hypothetical protein